MANPKFTSLELQIMEALWTAGQCSVREIQETFPVAGRPAYTTIQTTVYRLERKKAVRRAKRISRHYFVIDGGVRYVLGFGTSNRAAMLDTFDRVAKSFAFEEL